MFPRRLSDAVAFLVGLYFAVSALVPLVSASAAGGRGDNLSQIEHQIFNAVNDFRGERRLIALTRRADLDAVARAHSEDMVRRSFFAHEDPEGRNWVHRLEAAGISGFSLAGENVALTNRDGASVEIVTGWKNSPAHLQNLEARPFNTTGLGAAQAPDGTYYVTQLYLTFPQ